MSELADRIKSLAAQYHDDVVTYRRELHANPELAFEEVKTADFIAGKLQSFDIPFKRGIAKTGIVALIEGKNPGKKTIALRADMDALPIRETNDVPYKSKVAGLMHACGHDVHTSSLLGTARILAVLKGEFEGTVKLIFQPSEEKLPGGASVMIEEGVLEKPKPTSIFAQHVFPNLEAGQVGFRPGMYMASADEIRMTVRGKGGHAATPHENVDPVLIASHIIVALQQIVSRNAEPTIQSVLSFGRVIAEGATNVIPNEVYIEGTFRTMNEPWRADAHSKITKMAQEIASSMSGSCEIEIKKGYPCLYNDEELTQRAKNWAIDFLGEENVKDLNIRMTAEDFAYFSQLIPACFYRLGTGNKERGIISPVHTSTFDIDEAALETGMGLMSYLAIRELNQ